MSKKIYVSPSSQPKNIYAAGNTNEQEQCRKIAVALVEDLHRCGFEAMTNLTGDMYKRAEESDKWGADLHLPIHSNAYNNNVKGTVMFCYNTTGNGYKACKAIMETLAPITPGTSDSIRADKSLYEVWKPKASTAYIEVGFHDNVEEAQWIIDNTNAIAEAICKGICNFYGVKYVTDVVEDVPAKTEEPKVEKQLYRVFNAAGKQTGAFYVEDNAFNEARKQLQSGGAAKITLSDK